MTAILEERPTYGELRTEEEKEIDALALERVKRGIALLERDLGPRWVDKIDLATLDLPSGAACVLGQVYGSYRFAADRFFGGGPGRAGDARLHGFLEGNGVSYASLDNAWCKVLTPLVHRR